MLRAFKIFTVHGVEVYISEKAVIYIFLFPSSQHQKINRAFIFSSCIDPRANS